MAHHVLTRHRRALTAQRKDTLPKPGHAISKENERSIVRRHRMVRIGTSDYLREPLPLIDSSVGAIASLSPSEVWPA
jgi:hypothetical protein